jgi:hypothetical protein
VSVDEEGGRRAQTLLEVGSKWGIGVLKGGEDEAGFKIRMADKKGAVRQNWRDQPKNWR